MMKFTKAIALAALAAGFLATSAPAMADGAAAAPTPDFTFTGNINITNNYIFRGFSQTNGDFAVQGGFDLSHKSGLYIGTWASNVEFKDQTAPFSNSTTIEVDLYGGYKGTFGNSIFSYDIGGIYYSYPGNNGTGYNYWEFYGKVNADLGFMTIGTGFVYSPDFFANAGDAINIPINVSVPIPLGSDTWGLSVSGQLGYNKFTTTGVTWDGIHDDYLNWNVGLTVAITNWFNVDLRYHDTNLNKAYCKVSRCDSQFTFMVSRTF
jgi:uncharacterized protein (TIGR02001 family)